MSHHIDLYRSAPHTAYQVDYAALNCGRIVAASKRRIRFKFGYTNLDALSDGKTGQECRGSEHEVSITWSLSSGKQAIAFDQHEVYFDVGGSSQTKISHRWKDHLGHILEVKVHAANMSSKSNPDPDWKQYDLIVDGVSFFRMPKIFQIGVVAREVRQQQDNPKLSSPRFAVTPRSLDSRQGPSPPRTQAGELRNNSSNHMDSILPPEAPKRVEPKPVEVADLLSFDEFDAPAPAVSAPSQAAPAPAFAVPPQATLAPPVAALPQAAPAQNSISNAPAQINNNYAPAQTSTYAPVNYAPSINPCVAPENSFQAQDRGFSNNISPTTSPGAVECVPPDHTASYAHQPNPVTPPVRSSALVPAQPAPAGYGDDGAMKQLVNIDNLFGASTAEAPTTKESMEAKMQEANAHKSLGQLQGSTASHPKKPVMNPFNGAPAYPQQQQQQQQAMYCGSYGAPQQPQYNNFSQQSYGQAGFGYQ